tara:strand:+ start:90 stop:401 length:312 start_codon:yes stop_codon:yes gene_type:complete
VVLLLLVVRVVLLKPATLQDQQMMVLDTLDHLLVDGLLAVVVELHITIHQSNQQVVVPVVHTEVQETGLVIALSQMGVHMVDRPVQQIVGLVVVDQCLEDMVT